MECDLDAAGAAQSLETGTAPEGGFGDFSDATHVKSPGQESAQHDAVGSKDASVAKQEGPQTLIGSTHQMAELFTASKSEFLQLVSLQEKGCKYNRPGEAGHSRQGAPHFLGY